MEWLTPSLVLWAVGAWAFCFIFSCLFFDQQGELTVKMCTFKSVLYGVFAVMGAMVCRRVLTNLPLDPGAPLTPWALRVGLFFLFANVILDLFVLIPFINVGLRKRGKPTLTIMGWFWSIGVGYTGIVAQPWLAGVVADWAVENARLGQ